MSENNGHVLLMIGVDGEQHGGRLCREETEGHALSRVAALSVDGGRLAAVVAHHGKRLLEGVGHRRAAFEGHGNFWKVAKTKARERRRRRADPSGRLAVFSFLICILIACRTARTLNGRSPKIEEMKDLTLNECRIMPGLQLTPRHVARYSFTHNII